MITSGPVPSRPAVSEELLLRAGRCLHLTRAVEDAGHRLYLQGRLFGSFYGGRGQEATAVGAALAMSEVDVACPLIRDLGAHIVRGISPYEIVLHYLGRAGSLSEGREGNVHLGDLERGTMPMVSHLPEIMPVGMGIALARSWRGEPAAALLFCGDGATNGGVWHETMHLAALWNAPVVVVVERNMWAYMTPISRVLSTQRISGRAAGYGIETAEVDGNDVFAVHETVSEALERARLGGGPTLVEAWTYRMAGHGSHDSAAYVPENEREEWGRRDPLLAWRGHALAAGVPEKTLDTVESEAREEVASATERALAVPLPAYDESTHEVFA